MNTCRYCDLSQGEKSTGWGGKTRSMDGGGSGEGRGGKTRSMDGREGREKERKKKRKDEEYKKSKEGKIIQIFFHLINKIQTNI